MNAERLFWSRTDGGIRIALKVQPKARRSGVLGVEETADGPRLRVAVTEPPEGGRANEAVCSLLAKTLGVAPRTVQVVTGASSRLKLLTVSGDAEVLAARLLSIG